MIDLPQEPQLKAIFTGAGAFFLRSHSITPTLIIYAHSYPYEHTYANLIPMSNFKD